MMRILPIALLVLVPIVTSAQEIESLTNVRLTWDRDGARWKDATSPPPN